MLTSIQSAGVAPEVNLMITQARKHAKKGSSIALKPRADVTRSPKRGYQWPDKKDFCPSKILKKNNLLNVPIDTVLKPFEAGVKF